jgi:methylmalonyl-CoA mutase
VNKFKLTESRRSTPRDRQHGRARAQVARLQKIKASRDAGSVRRRSMPDEVRREQAGQLARARGRGARARATIGEISSALEKVWGRYAAEVRSISGVYGASYQDDAEWNALQSEIAQFATTEGRRPRLLVAKIGQDGHDRGAKVIATAFADLGFDVDVGTLFQTPEEVARQAVENDVHAVGVSTQSGGHKTLVPALVKELAKLGAGDIVVTVGGIVPQKDYAMLEQAGVKAVFGPGTNIPKAARKVLSLIVKAAHGAGTRRSA